MITDRITKKKTSAGDGGIKLQQVEPDLELRMLQKSNELGQIDVAVSWTLEAFARVTQGLGVEKKWPLKHEFFGLFWHIIQDICICIWHMTIVFNKIGTIGLKLNAFRYEENNEATFRRRPNSHPDLQCSQSVRFCLIDISGTSKFRIHMCTIWKS